MNHRWSLVAAACACLAVLAWILFGSEPRPAADPLAEGAAVPVAAPDERGAVLAATSDGPAAPSSGTERRAAAAEVAPVGAGLDHPWAAELAGVTGRVLEADGTPCKDLRVELLQIDTTLLLAAESTPLGNGSIELDETRTNDEGRFVLDGAYVGAFHLLGLDRGGPRSTLRFVETAVVLGERVDLGDIVLPGFGTLLGTVIDEEGEPVAGARVRVAPVPDIVVETGVLDLRADSLFAFATGGNDDGELQCLDIPKLIGDQLANLPIPTTYTATDGTFRLDGVPLKRIVGGVDHPGYVAAVIPGHDMSAGEHDLGELELVVGRTLTGRVVDAAGSPVAGAKVYGGVLQSLAPVGILQPAGVTDAAGVFTMRGVPEVGKLIGFARRAASDPWVSATAVGSAERLEFVLPTAARLTLHVLDQAGEPVRNARFDLQPDGPRGDFAEMTRVTLFANARTPRPPLAISEVEPGHYVAEGVSYGKWLVEAEADGYAPARQRVQHESDSTVVNLTCGPGQRLAVRVTDAATGAPVARAHVSVIAPTTALLGALDADWTGAEGTVDLGPFEPLVDAAALGAENGMPNESLLRVVHPGYGDHCAKFEPGSTTIDVKLTAACALVGRVHWGGATPERRYMLMLTREGIDGLAEAFAVPRLGLTDAEGHFRYAGLAAGRYDVHVAERYLDLDPLTLVIEQREPVMRHQVEVEVRPGEPVFVDVDLTPTGMGPTARVAGSVRANGAPVQGAVIELNGAEKVTLTTDARGEFESGELSALRGVWMTIDAEVDAPDGSRESRRLFQEWKQLPPGEVVRVDLDLELEAVPVLVVEAATGTPLAGATISPGDAGKAFTTGADGRADVVVDVKQGQMAAVNCDGYTSQQVHLRHDTVREAGVVRVALARPVTCSGRVVFPPGAEPTDSWSYLHVQQLEGSQSDGANLEVEGTEAPFTLSNLGPGRFRAQVYRNGQQSKPIEFELGPNGATDLVFEYEPQE